MWEKIKQNKRPQQGNWGIVWVESRRKEEGEFKKKKKTYKHSRWPIQWCQWGQQWMLVCWDHADGCHFCSSTHRKTEKNWEIEKRSFWGCHDGDDGEGLTWWAWRRYSRWPRHSQCTQSSNQCFEGCAAAGWFCLWKKVKMCDDHEQNYNNDECCRSLPAPKKPLNMDSGTEATSAIVWTFYVLKIAISKCSCVMVGFMHREVLWLLGDYDGIKCLYESDCLWEKLSWVLKINCWQQSI